MPTSPSANLWLERVFRTPLLTKLILLDLVINGLVFLVVQSIPRNLVEQVTLVSLGLVLVLNAALVAWALRPLQVLEATAHRVSNGEYEARSVMPPMADRNLVRIGDTLNSLLDRVVSERARARTLAAQVVAAGDLERARIARELHDGTAQSLSALDMLMTSTLQMEMDEVVTERIKVMQDIVHEALSEVRSLAHMVHPRVLDDLGLPAALEFLARRTRLGAALEVTVEVQGKRPLPPAVAAALYRIAQEASHNSLKYAAAEHIQMLLHIEQSAVHLRIEDDGHGFDPSAVDADHRGMGLFVMQERASLVDGTFALTSTPGGGTQVDVRIPLPKATA